MATLIRPTYTRLIPTDAVPIQHKGKPAVQFRDADGRKIIAPLTAKGDRCRVSATKWYGQYRDADGVVQREALSANKQAA